MRQEGEKKGGKGGRRDGRRTHRKNRQCLNPTPYTLTPQASAVPTPDTLHPNRRTHLKVGQRMKRQREIDYQEIAQLLPVSGFVVRRQDPEEHGLGFRV